MSVFMSSLLLESLFQGSSLSGPAQHILQTAGGIISLNHGDGGGRLSLEGGRGLQPFSFLGCGCDIILY